MKHDRLDTKTDSAINRALAAAMLVNVDAGIKIMIDAAVPPAVVARVFLSPRQRRASDWRH
jgi:hypothetical protein